jgi:hypothetical protein
VDRILAHDGSRVAEGDTVVSMSPDPDQVWEALRGLYFVGQMEDLPKVEQFGRGGSKEATDQLRRQATLTAQAIRTRSERNPNR